jgi:hypothetical protein
MTGSGGTMRKGRVVLAIGMLIVAAAPVAAQPTVRLRPVQSPQGASELGLTAAISAAADGAIVVTAQAGLLTIDKRVYSDGRFEVRLAHGRSDRVVITGEADGVSVATARNGAVRLQPNVDGDIEVKTRRARGWLAASGAVERFRQLVDVLDRDDVRSAEAVSLRATGALVAELFGDPGAARRLGRALAARSTEYRVARQESNPCWTTYSKQLLQSSYELESCSASYAAYNPLRAGCAFIWTLQVESAWFQFLGCSAFPLK